MPDAARGLVRRGGAALGRRLVVRRRLPGRRAGPRTAVAPGRGGRRLRQGRAGRHPLAAALRRVRRPARRAAGRRSSCRPPTTTCSARTGARGSRPPCTSTSTCAPATSSCASAGHPPGGAAARRVRPLGGARGRGAGARADARRRVHRASRGRIDRGDALLLFTDGLVETPQRDISLGIDKLLGQGERLLRGRLRAAAPSRLIDRLESHERRPGAAAAAPPLSGARCAGGAVERMTGIEPA